MSNTIIETVTGKLVDLADVKPTDISSIDIAWALSREPRFGGHTVTELPYTVGQHSVQVCIIVKEILTGAGIAFDATNGEFGAAVSFTKEVKRKIMLHSLLHDGSEAYLRDLPSPVKALPGIKEAYCAVEKTVMNVIFDRYNILDFMSTPEGLCSSRIVHWADLYARSIEAYHFMPSRGAHWVTNQKISLVGLQQFEMPKKSLDVFEEFLLWLEALTE